MENTKIININNLEATYLFESFQGLSKKNSNFQQLHLGGCKMENATFIHCEFANCTLQACILDQVKFINCTFINCKMSYSVGGDLEFIGCEFQEMEWKGTQTTKLEVNFCSLDENTNILVSEHDETLNKVFSN